ncbi:6-hydroxypseudooxynicotine dehydrogenase complex subunit alpha [Sulfitobacter pontiacus]|jgi:2-furoyl-CoA dehydrogenase FAD binding subunit|uniref:6-hydroxypseudooxynicotine dehydrogenase complex subunit alpha n=1 Tax=Sulfitobacter pontiacus TaxID=60137 RepID=A0AAX3A754_9RHOB|nr:FAD binding domain-containing protein [Sulfitobacter pontiacus]QLL41008.1 carbon monoxide dehydrogenase [Sulfitobacter pontiacus]UOA21637.1 6-hydroxypseudooxynicotine dehydrogenase complex subunit alpha [Sulfitobacter pontiacus]WPZ25433.1 FAD binding domain-containing protein [Sulfitobacter pontiacus]
MKPAPFDYVAATEMGEALEALHQGGTEARVIAGGQSLMPMLNMRLARPATLVDITRIPELSRIEAKGDNVTIGAAVRQSTLERWPDLADRVPLVRAALPWVGHTQLRNRGTVCGSVAHADPSAELPLCLIALGGTVTLRRRRKTRAVAARDFFQGMMSTDLAPGEMITSVTFPAHKTGTGYAFREVARRHGDFAIVACAAIARPDGTATLSVGGVADTPRTLDLPADAQGLDEQLNEFAWHLQARDDLHATARYRRDLVRQLGRATLKEALSCRD